MSSTKTAPLTEVSKVTPPVLQPSPDIQVAERAAYNTPASAQGETKRSGYGMPCAKCKTYYAASLSACPVCKTTERVPPTVASIPAAAKLNEQLPDPAALEEERERFLREFKAQTFASQLQIN